MNWFVVIAIISVTAQGQLDGKIIIEPDTYRSEADCATRIAEIASRDKIAKAKGQPTQNMILACRGIVIGVRV